MMSIRYFPSLRAQRSAAKWSAATQEIGNTAGAFPQKTQFSLLFTELADMSRAFWVATAFGLAMT
jgi:hypothetical protein